MTLTPEHKFNMHELASTSVVYRLFVIIMTQPEANKKNFSCLGLAVVHYHQHHHSDRLPAGEAAETSHGEQQLPAAPDSGELHKRLKLPTEDKSDQINKRDDLKKIHLKRVFSCVCVRSRGEILLTLLLVRLFRLRCRRRTSPRAPARSDPPTAAFRYYR